MYFLVSAFDDIKSTLVSAAAVCQFVSYHLSPHSPCENFNILKSGAVHMKNTPKIDFSKKIKFQEIAITFLSNLSLE